MLFADQGEDWGRPLWIVRIEFHIEELYIEFVVLGVARETLCFTKLSIYLGLRS